MTYVLVTYFENIKRFRLKIRGDLKSGSSLNKPSPDLFLLFHLTRMGKCFIILSEAEKDTLDQVFLISEKVQRAKKVF